MIKIGSFRRFRLIDFLALIILVMIWSLAAYLADLALGQDNLIGFLLIISSLVAVASFIIRKAGTVLLFYGLCSLFTFNSDSLGLTGLDKIIAFITAGLIFELVIFLFRIEFSNLHFGVILGTGLSIASIPWIMLILAKPTRELAFYASNFAILSFIMGIMGSVIGFLIWNSMKGLRWVIKFEYKV